MIAPSIPPDTPPVSSPKIPTDFFSLTAQPEESCSLPEVLTNQKTDFASLRAGIPLQPEVILNNTTADLIITVTTPLLIFLMSNAVLSFLLNVRFIYTTVLDLSLRVFAFFLVLGIVALNRLIARQGSEESVLYSFFLVMAVALYTLATTQLYGAGAVTRNFMNRSTLGALFFNTATVAGIWWMINRLTHECCVDEDEAAGDIGLFTATAERIRRVLQRAADPSPPKRNPQKAAEVSTPWYQIQAYDPNDIPIVVPDLEPESNGDYAEHLPEKYPGMAVFYFSIPVILVFSLGLRVIQHAGMAAVRMGAFYVAVYTFCALMLLSLTSLRQLRAYFSFRGVSMPRGSATAWLTISLLTVILIMVAAAYLPMPQLPPAAYVDEQQISVYEPYSGRLQLLHITPPTVSFFERYNVRSHFETVALVFTALMLVYILLKGMMFCVEILTAKKHSLPTFLSKLITALAWLLFKLWPSLFRWSFPKPRVRIQRQLALSARYDNPRKTPKLHQLSTREHIAYAYEALCALAIDVGSPAKASQTPYEFLKNFPKNLGRLREEAEEVIRLYVVAAYSTMEIDERIEDKLRKFWYAYRIVRNRYVR